MMKEHKYSYKGVEKTFAVSIEKVNTRHIYTLSHILDVVLDYPRTNLHHFFMGLICRLNDNYHNDTKEGTF